MDKFNRKESKVNRDSNLISINERYINFWYDRTNIETTSMIYDNERAIISEDFKYVNMRFLNHPRRFRKRASIVSRE